MLLDVVLYAEVGVNVAFRDCPVKVIIMCGKVFSPFFYQVIQVGCDCLVYVCFGYI